MKDIRDIALLVGVACAYGSTHAPQWEPLWIAIAAFVCGMAIQRCLEEQLSKSD